ncbi:4'-phosphopantetheinyl transferase superfamily protein [Pannus brasiliensis CCIBt3594]|uniref:4'-phosphopantetheinyl transferase superfamily protein n=1 Tax=Pannus brasiliensis CCIBt3594 TaxID=1427578 RepID=A0AAW9QP33_9CHRO
MGDRLPAPEVHLHFARLDVPPDEVERFTCLLSPDEIDRANRYYHDRDRRRFLVARGRLRELLGEYVGIEPEKIVFFYSERGKPSIGDSPHFNVSHSGEMAFYGFARGRRVGVDVERVRSLSDLSGLTKRFFCAKEHELIENHPERERVFFQLWTAKEAYLKAIGTGIAGGLNRVEVSIDPLQLENVGGDWNVYTYRPDGDYFATAAIEGNGYEVKTFGLSAI